MKSINLVPEEYFTRIAVARHVAGWSIAFACLIAGGAAGAWWQHGKVTKARADVADIERKELSVEQLRGQIADLAVDRTRIDTDIDRIRSLLGRKYRAALLADVAQCVGDDITLTSLSFDTGTDEPGASGRPAPSLSRREAALRPRARKPAPLKVDGPALRLNGFALSDIELARFIASLRDAKRIDGVQLVLAQQTPGIPGIKTFEVLCKPADTEDAE